MPLMLYLVVQLDHMCDNVDRNVRALDGYDTFHGMGFISACLRDGNFAAVEISNDC